MARIANRNFSDKTHRALKLRAAKRGPSAEAEIRNVLNAAVRPGERVKIGSALTAFGKRFGGVNLKPMSDMSPAKAASYE